MKLTDIRKIKEDKSVFAELASRFESKYDPAMDDAELETAISAFLVKNKVPEDELKAAYDFVYAHVSGT